MVLWREKQIGKLFDDNALYIFPFYTMNIWAVFFSLEQHKSSLLEFLTSANDIFLSRHFISGRIGRDFQAKSSVNLLKQASLNCNVSMFNSCRAHEESKCAN